MNVMLIAGQQESQAYHAQIAALESQLFDDAWDVSAVASSPAQFGVKVAVAVLDGAVVGYCIYQIIFEMSEILRIGTAKHAQGQGVANTLMMAVADDCQQQGAQRLLLEVRADNEPAIKLYQKHGFFQIDQRPNYYHGTDGGRIDALILQRQFS